MHELLPHCPVCGSQENHPFLVTNDHFLTGEKFTIQECRNCGFKFTNPRPGKNEMGSYYESTDYISHNAKKSDFLSTIYKIARTYAIRSKYSVVKKSTKGNNLLDIGCGTGEFLHYCTMHGFQGTGVEPGDVARDFARQNYNLDVRKDLESIEQQGLSFDCITLWHVLEHIHTLTDTITGIISLLNPDGIIVIAVPNCNCWDAKQYKDFWAAYDLPRHLYHFNEKTFRLLMNKNGLSIQKIIPQKLDSFYISLLSEKYKSGRQNFLSAFMNGLKSNIHAGKPHVGHSSLIFLISR